MAKFGPKAEEEVGKAMHEFKEGKLKSGKSGNKVSNPERAIAIGLSKAPTRKAAKCPPRKAEAENPTSRNSSVCPETDRVSSLALFPF